MFAEYCDACGETIGVDQGEYIYFVSHINFKNQGYVFHVQLHVCSFHGLASRPLLKINS